MNHHRDHAVVIGASMAGLLAGRVLSDHFKRVTIIERDELPEGPENRRGVPQGRHIHLLLPSGLGALERLLPGFTNELLDAGAPFVDDGSRGAWDILGHPLGGTPTPIPPSVQASRPLVEAAVRRRVLATAGLQLHGGQTVIEPLTTPDRSRVTGVRVADASGGPEEELHADLVVDATGRGARAPAWLERLGYARPAQDEVTVRLTYVSQLLRLPPLPVDIVYMGPNRWRSVGFGLLRCESDTWLLTVSDMGDHALRTTLRDMREAIAGLAPAYVNDALLRAEPLGDVARIGYPASQWRHYEKLRQFPEGLLVTGDALCSFNPIYGQGMSVAALEATALDQALREGDHELSRRFFRKASRIVSVAWDLSVGADLALPQVGHPRSVKTRLANAWTERVLTAAESDEAVSLQFYRVTALLDPPQTLMSPRIVRRVLGSRRRNAAPTGSRDYSNV